MRGWVCRSQLLLVLARSVILSHSPVGLMTTFYCLRFEIPTTWRARSPYSYPSRAGCPGYNPRHWVPFSSPPTTRRAVEVFDPASTWDHPCTSSPNIYIVCPLQRKLYTKWNFIHSLITRHCLKLIRGAIYTSLWRETLFVTYFIRCVSKET
jgi:hypothetical protein